MLYMMFEVTYHMWKSRSAYHMQHMTLLRLQNQNQNLVYFGQFSAQVEHMKGSDQR